MVNQTCDEACLSRYLDPVGERPSGVEGPCEALSGRSCLLATRHFPNQVQSLRFHHKIAEEHEW